MNNVGASSYKMSLIYDDKFESLELEGCESDYEGKVVFERRESFF